MPYFCNICKMYIEEKIRNTISKHKQEDKNMKFFKGVIVSSMFWAGTAIMYKEGIFDKSKTFKKGRRFIKRMGII